MQKEEFIAKLKEAKSADEILVLAKENGMELSEEKAKELFSELNASGELSDEELDKVAGGNIYDKFLDYFDELSKKKYGMSMEEMAKS